MLTLVVTHCWAAGRKVTVTLTDYVATGGTISIDGGRHR